MPQAQRTRPSADACKAGQQHQELSVALTTICPAPVLAQQKQIGYSSLLLSCSTESHILFVSLSLCQLLAGAEMLIGGSQQAVQAEQTPEFAWKASADEGCIC